MKNRSTVFKEFLDDLDQTMRKDIMVGAISEIKNAAKRRQGAEDRMTRQSKTSNCQDSSVMESIQAPAVENEPVAKDEGQPKSTSVKPLEA